MINLVLLTITSDRRNTVGITANSPLKHSAQRDVGATPMPLRQHGQASPASSPRNITKHLTRRMQTEERGLMLSSWPRMLCSI
jgi:hypothetical protein